MVVVAYNFWGLWLIFLDFSLLNGIGLTGRLRLFKVRDPADGVRRGVEGLGDRPGGQRRRQSVADGVCRSAARKGHFRADEEVLG